jgi:NADH:ubiquinone oxidoreductase subunit 5 (subunit L)/multisubunit Na+/H+ antiporter MnhA subunit
MDNLIIAILILPLIGFLINGLFGKHLPKVVVGGLATLVVFVSFVLAASIFSDYTADSSVTITNRPVITDDGINHHRNWFFNTPVLYRLYEP